ncbi:hypothetical protein [Ulvibacterium sp.]|uniref:hypothetical protein n=1 Tax=Ulvibacterium sp. TaxID=2665914 RepID=UPI003BA9595D
MAIRKKTIIGALAVPLLVLVVGLGVLQWRAKSIVANFLSRKIPNHMALAYSNIETNILGGDVILRDIALNISNRDTVLNHTSFTAQSLKINGLNYGQLFFKNTIYLDALTLKEPVLRYSPFNHHQKTGHTKKGIVGLLKTIFIQNLKIDNGSFYLFQEGKDSIKMAVESYNLMLSEGETGPMLITKKIPLSFKDYRLEVRETFVDMGTFETLNTSKIIISPNDSQINNIVLATKYSKEKLSTHLTVERDYVDLTIPKLEIGELNLGFKSDRFLVTVFESRFYRPNLEIYRDKRLPDNLQEKPLYSRLLRELPIGIDIAKISISDGYVAYEEKIEDTRKAGMLYFKQLDARINNIDNTGENKERTRVRASAEILGDGKLDLDWGFHINDPADTFTMSGSLMDLDSEKLSTFLKPNLRVKAKGTIDAMYFNFQGDSRESKGDMKMKYRDFRFEVLDRDRLKINKFLTFIGNIFVNDGSKADEDGFRFGDIETERDVTKSFFNYLWQNMENGILNTLTGDGKKDT